MIPQCIIYPCAVAFVINQHFKVQAVISAGFADVGRYDSIIMSTDDFFYGHSHFPVVGAYYFIDPSAGIFNDGVFAVFVWCFVYFNLPPWMILRQKLIRGRRIFSRGDLQSIAEDGGKC